MGWFANLYLLEVSRKGEQTVIETNVYRGDAGGKAYFSWGPGDRPKGLFSYANNTLFADTELTLLPGYPTIERMASEPFLLEASFYPKEESDGVVFHIILHEYYPMRNREPFIQPSKPSAFIDRDKVILTYPTKGSSQIQFWVSPLQETSFLADFEVTRLVTPQVVTKGKGKIGVNLFFISGEWEFGSAD